MRSSEQVDPVQVDVAVKVEDDVNHDVDSCGSDGCMYSAYCRMSTCTLPTAPVCE